MPLGDWRFTVRHVLSIQPLDCIRVLRKLNVQVVFEYGNTVQKPLIRNSPENESGETVIYIGQCREDQKLVQFSTMKVSCRALIATDGFQKFGKSGSEGDTFFIARPIVP